MKIIVEGTHRPPANKWYHDALFHCGRCGCVFQLTTEGVAYTDDEDTDDRIVYHDCPKCGDEVAVSWHAHEKARARSVLEGVVE